MPETILVVEDEPALRDTLSYNLKKDGFTVEAVGDGRAALDSARKLKPDLIVLDLMLPEIDGFEVCRILRKEMTTPILMLTARDDETDVLVGLGVGADDYLTKPFSMRELVARIRVLLRRVDRAAELANRAPAELVVGTLRIDQARRRVNSEGVDVHLTPTEFDLLVCLAAKPGTVLTREHLLAEVWDWQDAAGTRTVDSHVKSLRSKLGPQRVRTVHGVGYALEATS
jgi:DNA-binding response OmpR family regulator